MTDLEMTKLCAEAMGKPIILSTDGLGIGHIMINESSGSATSFNIYNYDPLHDDAQAMALVKKFRLFIAHDDTDFWVEWAGTIGGKDKVSWRAHPDINRAIVECVAKMQKAKA